MPCVAALGMHILGGPVYCGHAARIARVARAARAIAKLDGWASPSPTSRSRYLRWLSRRFFFLFRPRDRSLHHGHDDGRSVSRQVGQSAARPTCQPLLTRRPCLPAYPPTSLTLQRSLPRACYHPLRFLVQAALSVPALLGGEKTATRGYACEHGFLEAPPSSPAVWSTCSLLAEWRLSPSLVPGTLPCHCYFLRSGKGIL